MTQSNLGFIPEPITVAFEKLLPSRKAPDGLMSSRKFKQIISSIDAVGLIEPLTIAKADRTSGMHQLLKRAQPRVDSLKAALATKQEKK